MNHTEIQERNTSLSRHQQIWARLAWVIAALLILSIFLLALPVNLSELRQDPYQLRPILTQFGLSMEFLVVYTATLVCLLVLACLAIAVLIFWRKSENWFGLLVSLDLLFFITFLPIISSLSHVNPAWTLPLNIIRGLSILTTLLVFYLFPDGRFVPIWTRYLMGIWSFLVITLIITPGFTPAAAPIDIKTWQQAVEVIILIMILATGVFAQIYRFQRVSNSIQKQQMKWVVFGITGVVTGLALSSLPAVLFPTLRNPGMSSFLYIMFDIPASLLSLFMLPLSLAIAIFRYRLWDIDIIIRRTIVYGVLTLSLAVVYFGGIVLLQKLFQVITRQNQSPIALVISTLAIVLLFAPLRKRIQTNIDRRFYRRKYDADQMLRSFGNFVRKEVNQEKITEQLLLVVDEALQPKSLSLWVSHAPGKDDHTR